MRKELANDLNDFAKEVHALALEKGWWDPAPSFPEIVAMCHSELSEALEAWRKGGGWFGVDYLGDKPEGVAVEMADCVLRILDWAGREGIDLDEILKLAPTGTGGRDYDLAVRYTGRINYDWRRGDRADDRLLG